jgi:hypothetical protein
MNGALMPSTKNDSLLVEKPNDEKLTSYLFMDCYRQSW